MQSRVEVRQARQHDRARPDSEEEFNEQREALVEAAVWGGIEQPAPSPQPEHQREREEDRG